MLNINKRLLVVISLLFVAILLSSCNGNKNVEDNEVNNKVNQKISNDFEDTENDEKINEKEIVNSEKEDENISKGVYTEYSFEKLENINGNIVLFFHAPWCPSCKTTDKNISGEIIPDGLAILKVDYDSSNDLKQKYGITTQHTFVQVDNKGNMIEKWIGSRNVENILKKIK